MTSVYDELNAFYLTSEKLSKKGYCPMETVAGCYCFLDNVEFAVFSEGSTLPGFCETFSGMKLKYFTLTSQGHDIPGLRLSCSRSSSLDVFIGVAQSFLQPLHGTRADILRDPSKWAEEVKNTIGNRSYTKNTYQVLGELLLLKKILSQNNKAIWTGPRGGIVDIETDMDGFHNLEVKSTLQREGASVTISEEYQVKKANYLCFYRFEEDPHGELSIERLSTELIDLGYSQSELLDDFDYLGIKNTSEYKRKYHFVEERYYPITSDFPDITRLFPDGIKPKGIGKITYEILLDTLKYDNWPFVSH